jgi:hypothetical protein
MSCFFQGDAGADNILDPHGFTQTFQKIIRQGHHNATIGQGCLSGKGLAPRDGFPVVFSGRPKKISKM